VTLIHTALLCEAQSIIEKYNLKLHQKNPKIYKSDTLLVLISGMGKENTVNALEYVYRNFTFNCSVNIGIAGCNNNLIKIGELFCTNKNIDGILNANLDTVEEVQTKCLSSEIKLYDMEAKYFEEISLNYLSENDIFIFKIVSDYLVDKIQGKDIIKNLIQKKLTQLELYL
jgi:hypothetical protein